MAVAVVVISTADATSEADAILVADATPADAMVVAQEEVVETTAPSTIDATLEAAAVVALEAEAAGTLAQEAEAVITSWEVVEAEATLETLDLAAEIWAAAVVEETLEAETLEVDLAAGTWEAIWEEWAEIMVRGFGFLLVFFDINASPLIRFPDLKFRLNALFDERLMCFAGWNNGNGMGGGGGGGGGNWGGNMMGGGGGNMGGFGGGNMGGGGDNFGFNVCD